MIRRYADPVEVLVRPGSGSVPELFRWRGRCYRVQAVLGHWYERRRWWSDPLDQQARDAQVWRVQARVAKGRPSGVYDLCCDAGSWRLIGLMD